MKIPVRLVLRPAAANADAFLLLADSTRPLAEAFCHGFSAEVFRVRGGFVLIGTAEAHPPRGAIRLRRLSANFYLPADADIRPAFLPDELADLTAKRGLIAMPGEFLSFDPSRPLTPADWLTAPSVHRNAWHSIPPAPFQPDRLSRIEFRDDRPAAVLEILSQGQPDDAAPLTGADEAESDASIPEDVRPRTGSTAARMGAGALFAGARMMAWLGRQFNIPALAKFGGNLARKAVEKVPRVTEKILGAQEAALREILRQLQSGNAEQALKRAPVAVADPNDPPARVSESAQLNPVDPRYSLRNLLGSGGGGPGSVWLGGGDVWQLLAEEYRRLAREALARGDYRRAAYLYGVLLRDLRSAANALASGGLHRDAAILYRDKLNDPLAAAQAFERAGDADECLRLYEKMERYEEAAEMLRRSGDDERAEELYIRAAEAHARKDRWLAAGDLLRTKIGRHDLAGEYYTKGWTFSGPEIVPCGQRLMDHALATQDWAKAEELFNDAETRFFARTREADAFFNHAIQHREFLPEGQRSDWHDRVRLYFADHVGSSVKPLAMAGELFGHSKNWPPELLRDALHAAKGRTKVPEVEPPPERTKKLLDGTVVAVAVARESRDVIVASTTAVVCWRVKEQRIQRLPGGWIRNEVIGLALDSRAEHVFVLSRNGPVITLQTFNNHVAGYFKEGGKVEFEIGDLHRGEWYLAPRIWQSSQEPATVVANSHGHFLYRGLIPKADVTGSRLSHPPTYLLSVEDNFSECWIWDAGRLLYLSGLFDRTWQPHWHPDSPRGSSILVSPMETAARPGSLEIAAVDGKGILCWSRFESKLGEDHPRSHQLFSHHPDRFAAACLLRENVLAAVTFRNDLLWFRVHQGKLEQYAKPTPLNVPSQAVFLVSRPQAGEIAAILEDGSAILVPML